MTIEIPDEMFERLSNVGKEISEQNNRATSMPYFFQIQTTEQIAVPEGCGKEAWHYDSTLIETDDEINNCIYEWHDGEIIMEEIEKMDEYKKEEFLEKAGWQKVNYDYDEKYQNAFFTEKACKEHIQSNAHHYNKPVDYLTHAFRNPEMELVINFLITLGKERK